MRQKLPVSDRTRRESRYPDGVIFQLDEAPHQQCAAHTDQAFAVPMPTPRARGALRYQQQEPMARDVALDRRSYQQGCFRRSFRGPAGGCLTGVFLNTSGGMTAGDELSIHATAGADSA